MHYLESTAFSKKLVFASHNGTLIGRDLIIAIIMMTASAVSTV